jgi:hypothetical protein
LLGAIKDLYSLYGFNLEVGDEATDTLVQGCTVLRETVSY